MYDIEFILPISSKSYYLDRFKNFCRFGLINIGDYKVLVNFLCGQEEFPKDFLSFLTSQKINVNMYSSEVNHPAAKVYNFYSNYDDFNNSKWIVRLDDDSVTNVSLLMKHLSKFNYKKEYYFKSLESTIGDIKVDQKILKEFNLFNEINDFFGWDHEVEIAIMSQAVFKNVMTQNKEIIKRRSTIQDGYTDQLLCYLCKIQGIIPNSLSIITSEDRYHEFFINKFAHIHYIYRNDNFIKLILNSKNSNFSNLIFLFTFGNNLLDSIIISLKENSIVQHSFSNFIHEYSFWTLENEDLIIYDSNGDVTCIFKKFDFNKKNYSKINLKDMDSNFSKECTLSLLK